MAEIYPERPLEMEKLLMEYRNGSVPPLVARDDEEGSGLLNEEFLGILQKGFSAQYDIPLHISVVSAEHPGRPRVPVQEALSQQEVNKWLSCCRFLQLIRNINSKKHSGQEQQKTEFGPGYADLCVESCEHCSARKNLITKEAKAYMCYSGMIGLAVPVHVAGEIVAILSAECKKPKGGPIWPPELVEREACSITDKSSARALKKFDEKNSYSPKANTRAANIDLWEESKARIQQCEEMLGLESGQLLRELLEDVEADPGVEVSPHDLETIMTGLESAASHLSETADKSYRLGKESLVDWLRAEMASALSSADTFWDKIQWCFRNLAQLLGVDYILLISRDKPASAPLYLQCQYGLPEESLPAVKYDWTQSTARLDDFTRKVRALRHVQEIDLRQYRDIPILSMLYSLYGKGVSYHVSVASANTMDGGLTFMILGKKIAAESSALQSQSGEKTDYRRPDARHLREDDRQYLMTVVQELAIITNVFFSMQKLQETVEEQTNIMESVAHDLRTPIQNIMIAAENLREGRVDPERASRTIEGVVTQLQRLNLLAQKAWMLERIRLDKMIYNDEQTVKPYPLITECEQLLTDMAERRSIDIHIDPDIEHWQEIHVDAEMLRLVVLNLLHNGIKYSFPGTNIKIGGWQDGVGIAITFENEGICIHDEEKDRIFERYFRTRDAVKMDPSGSGIGLALVKEFVDHYEGRIDVRSTEVGFGRYLNVFSLFLPGR